MNSSERAVALRQSLAAWSDANQQTAADLADSYQELLPRRITNAQLSGLNNVVRAAPTFKEISDFVRHQSDKAVRAGRDDLADYWSAVGKALAGLRRDAEKIWLTVYAEPSSTTPPDKQAVDELHRRLAGEFVQHLVAHSQVTRGAMRW